jgi:hypothetical protein
MSFVQAQTYKQQLLGKRTSLGHYRAARAYNRVRFTGFVASFERYVNAVVDFATQADGTVDPATLGNLEDHFWAIVKNDPTGISVQAVVAEADLLFPNDEDADDADDVEGCFAFPDALEISAAAVPAGTDASRWLAESASTARVYKMPESGAVLIFVPSGHPSEATFRLYAPDGAEIARGEQNAWGGHSWVS